MSTSQNSTSRCRKPSEQDVQCCNKKELSLAIVTSTYVSILSNKGPPLHSETTSHFLSLGVMSFPILFMYVFIYFFMLCLTTPWTTQATWIDCKNDWWVPDLRRCEMKGCGRIWDALPSVGISGLWPKFWKQRRFEYDPGNVRCLSSHVRGPLCIVHRFMHACM